MSCSYGWRITGLFIRCWADVYVAECNLGQQSQSSSSTGAGGSQTSSSSSSSSSSLPSNLSYTSYILKQTPQVGGNALKQTLERCLLWHKQHLFWCLFFCCGFLIIFFCIYVLAYFEQSLNCFIKIWRKLKSICTFSIHHHRSYIWCLYGTAGLACTVCRELSFPRWILIFVF